MTGRVEGKVAFITGAARGQGRSHAIRLAEEGADIIAIDLLDQVGSVPYPMSTAEDMDETVRQVEALDRRIVAVKADIRDYDALKAALDAGVEQFGRLDIVAANAGISTFGRIDELSEVTWQDMIDINMTGVWHTAKAAIPHLKAGGRGGSIAIISSGAGLMGVQNIGHYVTAKHGLVGLMRTLAMELASDMIRVNSIHPGNVDTAMIHNDAMYNLFRPDLEHPTVDDVREGFQSIHLMPIPWLDPIDISNALLFLASDEARYITGVPLPVDGGAVIK
ncbi:mycofactocin-coupled SDR family oxidoreductase [Rhodococcus opacus]|uniref:mycofactocin-coupled SDR family oxidoreductase n=1 Tax=Rhodococcus opacus TaxID=37919 RepID=UPI002473D75B|nr:mycofactocin-coupled SDR family oxidoreductase [Rhodococcus opacus]MDH6291317.1 (+)-trans-carveol dehydrogenase [Rhodococcus opacus]